MYNVHCTQKRDKNRFWSLERANLPSNTMFIIFTYNHAYVTDFEWIRWCGVVMLRVQVHPSALVTQFRWCWVNEHPLAHKSKWSNAHRFIYSTPYWWLKLTISWASAEKNCSQALLANQWLEAFDGKCVNFVERENRFCCCLSLCEFCLFRQVLHIIARAICKQFRGVSQWNVSHTCHYSFVD